MREKPRVFEIDLDSQGEGTFTIRIDGEALRNALPEELESEAEELRRQFDEVLTASLAKRKRTSKDDTLAVPA